MHIPVLLSLQKNGQETIDMARSRRTTVTAAPDFADAYDLDNLFRRNSKARKVAERLLTGEELSRAELVHGLGLSLTTVPRVVDSLESVGFRIHRDTDPHTRHARFRVFGFAGADSATPADRGGSVVATYSAVDNGAPCRVLGVRVDPTDHDTVTVDFEIAEIGAYSGLLVHPAGQSQNIPATLIGGETFVKSWLLLDTGKMNVRIGGAEARHGAIEVRDLEAVTAAVPVEIASPPKQRRRA